MPNDCVCEKERDEEKGSRSKDKKEGGAEERERGREEEGHFTVEWGVQFWATKGHRVPSDPAARFQTRFALRIQHGPHRQTNLKYAGPWVSSVKWSHPPSALSVRQEFRSEKVGAAFQHCYPSSAAAATAAAAELGPNGRP